MPLRRPVLSIASPAALTLLAASALASPASAQVAGSWHVAGKVAAFGFTLDCQFEPSGAKLGGVCVDASTSDPKIKGGRAHPLTAGSVKGDAVSWTYQSSFLLTKFDVTFTGTLAGDRMSGTIDAGGRKGDFTATRN